MQLLATLRPIQLTSQYVLLATKHSLHGKHHLIVQPLFEQWSYTTIKMVPWRLTH